MINDGLAQMSASLPPTPSLLLISIIGNLGGLRSSEQVGGSPALWY